MHPDHIRFKILNVLYQKHFSGFAGIPIATAQMIKDAGLEDVDQNLVIGHILILAEDGMIHNQKTIPSKSFTVRITSKGAKVVENIVEAAVEKIEKSKSEAFKDTLAKSIHLGKYAKDHPEFVKDNLEPLLSNYLS